ncbi:MAG: hypothetical protein ACOYLB_13655 [Phototrophicaceae bacterium]
MNKKPPRTLGINLAIILSVLFFTAFPFIHTGYSLILQDHMRDSQVLVGSNFNLAPPIPSITENAYVNLVFEIFIPLGFFALCAITWIGKPTYIRHIFSVGVVWMMVRMWLRLYVIQEDGALFISNGFIHTLQTAYAIFSSLVGVYVLWYINRAPARAFFRGYYLQEPSADQDD